MLSQTGRRPPTNRPLVAETMEWSHPPRDQASRIVPKNRIRRSPPKAGSTPKPYRFPKFPAEDPSGPNPFRGGFPVSGPYAVEFPLSNPEAIIPLTMPRIGCCQETEFLLILSCNPRTRRGVPPSVHGFRPLIGDDRKVYFPHRSPSSTVKLTSLTATCLPYLYEDGKPRWPLGKY